ncbi:disintegrin and metalloproteinase domain-containing protein 12 [Phlebotomus argentipes]|uniref:disintegrin and metalloproteinase domain-containing protein 12 n=1 Tax=Phlebotomus argentipes TaxID=94469 RepID=UPI0028937F7E|nr:disintegrin and metalloproteinase domain-containing protein 12 [Phlebotomus argentipes]
MARISSVVYNACSSSGNYDKCALLCFPRQLFRLVSSAVTKCSRHSDLIGGRVIRNVLLCIALLNVLFVDFGDAHGIHLANERIHPAEQFSSFTLIRPRVIHGHHKRSINTTLEEDGLHATHITLSFEKASGESVVLDLQLNEDLLPQGHFLHYQDGLGGHRVQNFTGREDMDHCHYLGRIRGNRKSRAAISTCDGIRGVIFDGEETFYVESTPNSQLHSDHFLYSHSDIEWQSVGKCGYEGTQESQNSTNELKHSEFNRILRYKRAVEDSETIRGPYNANRDSSFVELLLVVDNKVYNALGQSLKRVHNHCKTIANIINALYMPLNIFIALIGVVVWTDTNEVELTSDGDKTLKNFLYYRKKVLVQKFPNDNAQLLTREQFEGGVVGKALKGPICTYEFSGGVSMDHSQIIGVVATTVAHEMGHNFGMEHDSADCRCEDERCIMSASSSSVAPRHWSSCSIDQLNLAFHHGMNHCLKNRPARLFDSPQCGNGFVEKGEQCDCGLPEYCENSCCDPLTCMLHANASCATGECCDLDTCRPRTAGTVCRTADGECDLPEFCTGESEYCPNDVFKRDTEECDGGKAFCYQGSCRSRADQCKVLWGPSGNSSDECYSKNIDGTRHGNCGFERFSNQYINCDREDIYCGMLHCRHLNERLEFGMESVSVLSHSFMNHENRIVVCRTAIVDLGLQSMDPGLAPDGSKCGDNKMCVKQKCRPIASLRMEGTGVACPDDCNGNGICNSQGHCHCDRGFAPPFCDAPGPGGSVDSGPASNPNAGAGFTTAMYIFFLGIVPLCALVAFLVYYFRQNRTMIKRTPQVPKQLIKQSPSKSHSPSSGGQPKSTPSSPDDMNSALLRSSRQEQESSLLNNNMFGKFKGFTLKPLPNATSTNFGAPNVAFVAPVAKQVEEEEEQSGVPNRVAPPVPKVPNNVAIVTRSQTQVKSPVKSPTLTRSVSIDRPAPALPPPNPGAHPRPLISSPILEASTCTAKELMSPLKNSGSGRFPVRPAPQTPSQPVAADTPDGYDAPLPREPKGGTLKRITSFLKKEEKPPVEKKQHRVIDRERLKTIEISAPIPLPETNKTLNRTQSMRSPTRKAPQPSFGSMRQPSPLNRPPSIVGSRPKSPPPRPPAPPTLPVVNGYQKPPPPKKVVSPPESSPEYADCEDGEAPLAHISEESTPVTPPDNIYSVIEEPPTPPKIPSPPKVGVQSLSTSVESMGLLGEIVNEIENRNLDSIYSVSTLRKKKPGEDDDQTYANTTMQESEDEYMNMKSNSSTTSSGYLRPTSINTPIARIAPTKPPEKPVPFSSFRSPPAPAQTPASAVTPTEQKNPVQTEKSAVVQLKAKESKEEEKKPKYQPYHTSINRPGPYAASYRSGAKKDDKDAKPPTVRARTPSPKKNPDVVPSNAPPPIKSKPPDVVNNGPTKPQTAQKPNIVAKPRHNSTAKTAKMKSPTDPQLPNGQGPVMASSKSRILTAAASRAPGKASTVAALQQKFEGGGGKK